MVEARGIEPLLAGWIWLDFIGFFGLFGPVREHFVINFVWFYIVQFDLGSSCLSLGLLLGVAV